MQQIDDTTRALLTHLHRGGAWGYWWYLDAERTYTDARGEQQPLKRTDWWKADRPTPLRYEATEHVYFGVHPVSAIPRTRVNGKTKEPYTVKPERVRAIIPDIAAINCLFGEFDKAPLETVERLDPPPSVIIESSPGKYHAYWLLDAPLLLVDEATRKRAQQVQAGWVAFVGSDADAKDLARVLRVPNCRNVKPSYAPSYPVVAIRQAELERTYAIDELAARCAHLMPSTLKTKTPSTGSGRYTPTSPSEVGGLLQRLAGSRADRYNEWLAVGCCLRPLGVDGLNLWDEWSRQSDKYDDGICENKWYTLPEDNEGLGKLAYWASQDSPEAPRVDTRTRAAVAHTNGFHDDAPFADDEPPYETNETPERVQNQTQSSMFLDALGRLGYTFRLNLCNDTIEINGEPITDILSAQIRTQMRDAGFKGLGAMEDAFVAEAARNAYHPIRDYLNGLQWDGHDHIGDLISKLHSDDAPILDPDGDEVLLHGIYLARWLIGAVAKCLSNRQNLMLVLAGPQGLGKSAFAAWLCSSIPAYFLEEPINTTDKDSEVRLMSNFIWEVGELDATTRKADVSALKAFITKKTVTVRKSYGRHDTVKPALASLIGTVNNGSGFLMDETGNRRYYITSIIKIDWSYTKLNVDQIWAQAVALYHQGEPWQLQPWEAAQQQHVNKNYEVESILEGWIERCFVVTREPKDTMTAAEIVDHLRTVYEIRLQGSERAQAMEISRVLARIGIQKERRHGWRGYAGITPEFPNVGA